MPSVLGCTARNPAILSRLAAFFRDDADPWERLEIELPPQVFGRASTRAFAEYLEGVSRVAVRSLDDVLAWLRGCETAEDPALFRESDFWQHPVSFEYLRKGDCEDHALWAWRQLVQLRIPAFFVAGLWRGTPHAWVHITDGTREVLLESTAKNGEMLLPITHARASYLPALAVDARLRTFVYQGYLPFHQAARSTGLQASSSTLSPRQSLTHPRSPRRAGAPSTPPACEIAILAGGRSSRMGRDKSRLRLDGRSLLTHVRTAACGLTPRPPIRIIRHDLQPGRGPLGGIQTALSRARAPIVLVLPCDMPFITPALLRRVLAAMRSRTHATFVTTAGRWGFPLALRTATLPIVTRLLDLGHLSLAQLAETLHARALPLSDRLARQTFNVNCPADLAQLRLRARRRRSRTSSA